MSQSGVQHFHVHNPQSAFEIMDKPEVPPPQLRGRARGVAKTSGVLSVRPRQRPPRPVPILQVNLDGTVNYANELFELVFGWHHGELKNLYAEAVLRPNDVVRDLEPDQWRAYDEVRDGTRDECHFETHLDARDGHAVRVGLTAKLIHHHKFVQVELEILSDEPVLRDHRAQFADPFMRMEFEDHLFAARQEEIRVLTEKVDLLEVQVANKHRRPKRPGHRPSNPNLNTREKFTTALHAAIRTSRDVWHPRIGEVCDALGAKSENSLKDWLLYYGLLRHGSVARTLDEIAEELGIRGDSFL